MEMFPVLKISAGYRTMTSQNRPFSKMATARGETGNWGYGTVGDCN